MIKKLLVLSFLIISFGLIAEAPRAEALSFAPCDGGESECAYQRCLNYNTEQEWLRSMPSTKSSAKAERSCEELKFTAVVEKAYPWVLAVLAAASVTVFVIYKKRNAK